MDRGPVPERSSGSRAAGLAALVLMLAVLGLTVFSYYSPGPSEPRTAAIPMQEAPATAAAALEASPPRAMGDATAEQESLGIASAPDPLPPKPLAAEPSPPASAIPGTAPAQEAPRAPQPRAKISKPQRGASARLIIAVAPHGELYIDGKHHGTTPPITTLVLEPGMHRIEIRSGSRKPYLTYMAVQAGEQRRIRHDFGAKPSGPPI